MAVLNPDHFFDQADGLTASLVAGPPRQVDLRRAISNAYYGLFHFILTELADEFVGTTKRNLPRYNAVYRSLDHRTLKLVCLSLGKQTPSTHFRDFLPAEGLGDAMINFAAAVAKLQRKRHSADYDPTSRFTTSDARLAISTARRAIDRFNGATIERRKAFLTLLLCPPRQG